jgi:hypothetical protein
LGEGIERPPDGAGDGIQARQNENDAQPKDLLVGHAAFLAVGEQLAQQVRTLFGAALADVRRQLARHFGGVRSSIGNPNSVRNTTGGKGTASVLTTSHVLPAAAMSSMSAPTWPCCGAEELVQHPPVTGVFRPLRALQVELPPAADR